MHSGRVSEFVLQFGFVDFDSDSDSDCDSGSGFPQMQRRSWKNRLSVRVLR